MSLRFQADADLNPEIGRGLRRREPAIDFRAAAGVIPDDGTPDLEVLRMAADAGRVLVSRDVTTMPDQFEGFVSGNTSPGLILIPSRRPIGEVIEDLLVIWLTWPDEALRNQLRWLPRSR